jgi:hypothetical protein
LRLDLVSADSLPDRLVFGVGRRRRTHQQPLQTRVLVGFHPAIRSRRDDDHVARTDRVIHAAVANEAGSRPDRDRDIAVGCMDRDELSRLEVPTDDVHTIAPEHLPGAEAVVVRPFGVEIGPDHQDPSPPSGRHRS